jgi:hypothetical protein
MTNKPGRLCHDPRGNIVAPGLRHVTFLFRQDQNENDKQSGIDFSTNFKTNSHSLN